MSAFDYIINIIESSIIGLYSYKFLNIKDMKKLILLIITLFIEISLCNIYIPTSWILTILMVFTVILWGKLNLNNITIEFLFMSIIVIVFDMIANILAMAIYVLLDSLQLILETNIPSIVIMTIFSKIIFLSIVLLFANYYKSIEMKLDRKKWSSIVLVLFLLLLSGGILIQDLSLNNLNERNTLISILSIVVASFLVLRVYNKLLIENEEKMKVILKNKEIKYKKANYDLISKMCEDISNLQHYLRYILMMEQGCIEKHEYEKGLELIKTYLDKFDKFKIIVNTNNPYFDFNMNNMISELKEYGIDVNVIVAISQNDFYFNNEYIEYILNILKTYKAIATKMTINIQENKKDNLINIVVQSNSNKKIIFDKRFRVLAETFNAQYVVKYVDNLIVFKSIQEMM